MKHFCKRVVLCLSILIVLIVFVGCERQIPDVSFGGSHAVYEVGQNQMVDPYALQPSTSELDQENPENVKDEPEAAETVLPNENEKTPDLDETPTPEATNTLTTDPDATDPVATDPAPTDSVPTEPAPANPTEIVDEDPTPTPTKKPTSEKEAFFAYWAGDWAFWFESGGMLLEGKLTFLESQDNLVGKTELDGKTYGFTIEYVKSQPLYETFISGIWISEGMQNGMLFRLKPINETQAAGHHSRPSQTFCMSRDAAQKPDPCFLGIFDN